MTTMAEYRSVLQREPPTKPAAAPGDGSDDSSSSDEEVPTTKIAHEDLTEIINWCGSEVLRTSQFVSSQNKSKKNGPPAKKFGEYAIVTRRTLDDDRRTVLSVVMEIQSKRLQKELQKMVEFPGAVDLKANPILIPKPYQLLFYERDKIRRFKHESTELGNEMQLLADFIRTDDGIRSIRKEHKYLISRRKISWRIVWTIFQPGQLVVFNIDGVVTIRRLVKFKLAQLNFMAVGLGIGYNGTRLGETKDRRILRPFNGIRDIESLPVVPLKYWKDGEKLKERLIERGKKWVRLVKSPRHMAFNGLCENPFGNDFLLNERIILDNDAFLDEYVLYRPKLLPEPTNEADQANGASCIPKDADLSDDEDDGQISVAGSEPVHVSAADAAGADPLSEEIDSTAKNLESEPEEDKELTDDEYWRCPARIPGFPLRSKKWGFFLIEEPMLTEIQWKDGAFDMLQMVKFKKDLVKSLIDGHKNEVRTFDDIVEGKGRGLVFLLHGPPGLGKTLMAESISEHTRRPLYSISSGELSTEIQGMEKQITRIFKMGNKWKALVLLDEADVLMSRRTPGNLEQNAIVSVFLRLMEYYEGILFLTTNRHEDFDDAIYNRIHITLAFEKISHDVRQVIWRNILESNAAIIDIDKKCWTPEVFAVLGKFEINGRSIKNLLRTAACFAQSEGRPLAVRHLYAVMRVNLLVEEKFRAAMEGLTELIPPQPES